MWLAWLIVYAPARDYASCVRLQRLQLMALVAAQRQRRAEQALSRGDVGLEGAPAADGAPGSSLETFQSIVISLKDSSQKRYAAEMLLGSMQSQIMPIALMQQ